MKVKNINDTRVTSCPCGSWLEHWKKHSNQPLSIFCAVLDCIQKPEVGTHVQKDGSDDNGWYVVPLCTAHNDAPYWSLYITESVALVSANVDRSCGKVKSRVADGSDNVDSVFESNQQ